jgi:hypothetical protein
LLWRRTLLETSRKWPHRYVLRELSSSFREHSTSVREHSSSCSSNHYTVSWWDNFELATLHTHVNLASFTFKKLAMTYVQGIVTSIKTWRARGL